MSISISTFGDCCGARIIYGFLYPGNFQTTESYLEEQEKQLKYVMKRLDDYNYVCVINDSQYYGCSELMKNLGFNLVAVNRNSSGRGGRTLYTYSFTNHDADDSDKAEAGFPV